MRANSSKPGSGSLVVNYKGGKMEHTKTKLHNRACKLLGIPSDKFQLVSPSQYKEITGQGVSNYLGLAYRQYKIYYVRRGEPLRTYVHELLHLLFKSKPHWWVYAVSWKLTGITKNMKLDKSYGYGNGYHVSAERIKELPSKQKLLAQIQRTSTKG